MSEGSPPQQPGKPGARTKCPICRSSRGSGKGGRSGLYEPALLDSLVQTIATGTLAVDAAAHHGIAPSTFHEWVRRGQHPTCVCGRKTPPELVAFAAALEKGKAKRRTVLIARIAKAAQDPKHWTAAAWILERTEPELFAQRVQVVVRQELEAALDRLEAEFEGEPDTLDRILGILAGGTGSGAPRTASRAAAAADGGSAAAADPSPAVADPIGVPRPHQ